jgi:protein-S-isoprenylcysteine O-methyltransferase Ste14
MSVPYLMLAGGWVVWCILHSLLISHTVSERVQSWLGKYQFYYRLFFNLIAMVTLLPLMMATADLRGDIVYSWVGLWQALRIGGLAFSLWLFRDGAKIYDTGYLLGMSQIRFRRHRTLLAENGKFSRRGALGIVRHPWYAGSLLLLWTVLPHYHMSSVIAAGVLSLYLIIGSWLEEQKILLVYGDEYRRYQQEVSMLFPLKWLMRRILGDAGNGPD